MAVTHITFDFEYDLADKYLYQTNELGLKATWTYKGPARIWVQVNRETGYLNPSNDCLADDGTEATAAIAKAQAGLDHVAVLVHAKEQPIIASVMWMEIDQADFPQVEFTREDVDPTDTTVYYSRAATPTLDHTYEVGEMRYDIDSESWITPFPWKKPHMTWEVLDTGRTQIIADAKQSKADLENDADATEGQWTDLISDLDDFIAELEAIPTKFPRDTWDPWMVPFPSDPRVNFDEVEVAEQTSGPIVDGGIK